MKKFFINNVCTLDCTVLVPNYLSYFLNTKVFYVNDLLFLDKNEKYVTKYNWGNIMKIKLT